MSFLLLGGDGSSRPTFFEVVAAERLMPSLKAAVVYSLSVSVTFLIPKCRLSCVGLYGNRADWTGLGCRCSRRGVPSPIGCLIGKTRYLRSSALFWTVSHCPITVHHLQTVCMACAARHMMPGIPQQRLSGCSAELNNTGHCCSW